MTYPLIRYPLDPTGLNPNNLVIGELADLPSKPIRAISPIYGPVFSDSVRVWDDITNVELVRNVGFKTVEILQDACLKFGKEIVSIILIFDTSVTKARYNYQVLGGLYQWSSGEALENMYETVMQDNRPVDWVNVLNRPTTFPPTLHRHLLEDVFGWEEVVLSLERLKNVVSLNNVPAFEALIDWVNLRLSTLPTGGCDCPTVDNNTIDNILPSDNFLTWNNLLYALDKLNFNGLKLLEKYSLINNGDILNYTLCSTNLPDNTTLYWTIENITTNNLDFSTTNGIININDNIGHFSVVVTGIVGNEPRETFRVAIRKNSITGPVLLQTGIITIESVQVTTLTSLYKLLTTCSNYARNRNIETTTRTLFILNSKNC